MLRLTITDPSGTRTVECDREEVVIGRRDGVDVQIADPAASRNHCVLRREGSRVQLIDLGSANGVSIGRLKVTEAILRPGQQFRIGETTIRIESSGLMLDEAPAAGPRAPVATGVTPDFGRELRAMLARTPWYMVSLIVHLLAMLVLSQVPFSIKVNALPGRIHAVKPKELAEIDTELDDYEPEAPAAEEEILDDSLAENDDAGEPEQDQAEAAGEELDADDDKLGTGESLTSRRGIRLLAPNPKIKDGGAAVDKHNLKKSHATARKTVERGMGRGLRNIRSRGKQILVIKGDFDKMENVLDLYKVKYTMVTRDEFQRRRLNRFAVICANCARKPTSRTDAKRLADKIERFVRNGGWFISSDWSIEPYLTLGWPEVVRVVPPKRRQTDTTISVEPATSTPLLRTMFARKQRTRWWLEETSTFFKVTSKANVLVRSSDMLTRFGAATVVFEFRSGRGRALHLLGHFWQEDGNLAGLVAMHRLVLNFLQERFPQE